jgi:hypothetical protein
MPKGGAVRQPDDRQMRILTVVAAGGAAPVTPEAPHRMKRQELWSWGRGASSAAAFGGQQFMGWTADRALSVGEEILIDELDEPVPAETGIVTGMDDARGNVPQSTHRPQVS